MTDFEIVEKDRDALYIGNIRTVEFDLKLPSKGENGSRITWESGHDRIISPDGKVTRPKFGMGNRVVPLTAVLSCGQAQTKRVFQVRVLEEENKIQIEEVFPISLEAEKGKLCCLPTAAAVRTREGRVISHQIEWENHGEVTFDHVGTFTETGVIAGTKYPVTAVVEVRDHLQPAYKSREPFVHALSKETALCGDSWFLRAQHWSEAFLLSVNDDQMLYNFRTASGLDTKGAPAMIGWDAPDSKLRGHTTGHYLSGLALCYRATGNKAIREKAVYMCRSLEECQDAFGRMAGIHEGFLSGYDETQFDLLEQYVRYPEIWAPYYTLHKILAGLLDCYEYAGIDTGLQVASRLGEWVYRRLSRLAPHTRKTMWSIYIAGEFGGMNEVMARLYQLTGNEDYLQGARFFDNDKLFFPLLQNIDALDGMHANQHIPQVIGCMKLFEVTGEKKYYDMASTFWKNVTRDHAYVIGGTGEGEMFHGPGEIGRILTKNTAESCASYNMLKLTKALCRYQLDSRYMDYYERVMFNHIASSCDHAPTGASTYFMPLAPGYHKEFDDENSCCHGTGLENHFRYTDSLYFANEESVYVNLFVPSELRMKDLSIVQRVDAENPGHITLAVEGDGRYALGIRVPGWCEGNWTVTMDGAAVPAERDERGYLTVQADWTTKKCLEVQFPCTLRVEPTPDVPDTAALLYGPYVLAALTDSTDYLQLPFSDRKELDRVEKREGLRFCYGDLTFVPLCAICHEGYQVYFKCR